MTYNELPYIWYKLNLRWTCDIQQHPGDRVKPKNDYKCCTYSSAVNSLAPTSARGDFDFWEKIYSYRSY